MPTGSSPESWPHKCLKRVALFMFSKSKTLRVDHRHGADKEDWRIDQRQMRSEWKRAYPAESRRAAHPARHQSFLQNAKTPGDELAVQLAGSYESAFFGCQTLDSGYTRSAAKIHRACGLTCLADPGRAGVVERSRHFMAHWRDRGAMCGRDTSSFAKWLAVPRSQPSS